MEVAARRPALSIWLMAARPRTLAASIAPVIAGTAVAARAGGLRPAVALLALLSSICIQIGTNFANDYSDFKRGADAERVGPARVTQSGLVAREMVKRAAIIAFACAMALGIAIALASGWPIVVIGIASIAAGWLYTGGPWPLGYHGLGDLFVFIFFGLVATCGTAYAQALSVPPSAWIAGAAVGALATAILVVNNLRDRTTDAKVGKNTLAVKLGPAATRAEYVLLLAAAFALSLFLGRPWPLLALPLAIPPLRRVLKQDGAALNPALGETGRLLLAFSLLLAVELWP
ncbi:MAG: 1,4-dihydroxy-2-naphthoate polyprenyltransferase [Deltaproteobacteria bacterium]|nr:MAG: 1,4-dihydroxy-2-naphthoate polyprenyltransferase [Deltaproteobacteria bacterium]